MSHHSYEELAAVMGHWGEKPRRIRPDIELAGSPERTAFRVVMETDAGRLLVLEEIPPGRHDHKRTISRTLELLHRRKLPGICPSLRSKTGEYIVSRGERYWQLVPFIPGHALSRPAWAFEGWRGRALGGFLIGLRKTSRNIPFFRPAHPFSIRIYIEDFMKRLKQHNPEQLPETEPVLRFLEKGFMAAHDSLPVAFCHGDVHPLNVIWGKRGIRAVIDWEFLGYKPEMYDIANLIGCIGMEDPDALFGELVASLFATLSAGGLITGPVRTWLVEFIVALRFAWLAEWLRKRDHEMIALETVYMNLLTRHAGMLRAEWGLSDESPAGG
ncbi:aminoglycoside phosphotransferase family protein [Desulfonema ishimotonii]|uniref:Aminoglycoside phosphotransferase family protein n=1 Tax=Desulfonema ishimotonii TaxID=45657 RepID=A0A401G2V7_9BACT|nr:aminoglycoside phosphotransferase family protein [Desulfonema ishimotonii]GBC63579.1 aminoglycoside phosphotransferase family protein [Desulfonema ishimotonii]